MASTLVVTHCQCGVTWWIEHRSPWTHPKDTRGVAMNSQTRSDRAERHGIVGVHHRGILGGWSHHCSCGAIIIEPDGGHKVTDAHLGGAPNPDGLTP